MNKNIGNEAIYDATTLGTPKMLVLGLQHMFAMFGATVLVPALTGLDVATTLLFAGLGTLLFHLITKGKVPAFLGSSFAYLAGYWAIAPNGEANLLPYACIINSRNHSAGAGTAAEVGVLAIVSAASAKAEADLGNGDQGHAVWRGDGLADDGIGVSHGMDLIHGGAHQIGQGIFLLRRIVHLVNHPF